MQKEPVISLKCKRVQVKRAQEQIQEALFPEERHLAAEISQKQEISEQLEI